MISCQIDSVSGSEIVSSSEFKSFARIDTSDDDSIVADIIKAARMKCEAIINRDIVAKTRTLFISNVDYSGEYGNLYRKRMKIVLPFAPIASITSVQSQDSDGNLSTASYESYGFDDKYIELSSSDSKNIKIVYVTSGMNHEDLALAIKQLGASYYDNRADFVKGTIVSKMPTNVQTILSPYIYYNEV